MYFHTSHVVAGLASKVKRSDSLASKLRYRPSRDELIEKHIIESKYALDFLYFRPRKACHNPIRTVCSGICPVDSQQR